MLEFFVSRWRQAQERRNIDSYLNQIKADRELAREMARQFTKTPASH